MKKITHQAFDIAVMGGGPAGVVIASQLADYGFSVVIIERQNVSLTASFGQSISTLVMDLLKKVGFSDALKNIDVLESRQRILSWHHPTSETINSPKHKVSFLLDRKQLDDKLRQTVIAKNAILLQPARTSKIQRDNLGWILSVSRQSSHYRLRVAYLVDARGGYSHRGDQIPLSAKTVALTTTLHQVPKSLQTHGVQRLEALPEGWLWGAPLADNRMYLVAAMDTTVLQGLGKAGQQQLLRQLLANSLLFEECLSTDTWEPVRVHDITSRIAKKTVTNDFMSVGSRAFYPDPLSSQGMLSALRSAVQGASVIRTIMHRPTDKQMAIGFYESSLRHCARQHQKTLCDQYRAVAHYSNYAFWRTRNNTIPSVPQIERRNNSLDCDNHTDQIIRLTADSVISSTPVLKDGWVENQDALSTPQLDIPVAYVKGVELIPLLLPLKQGCSLSTLFHHWVKKIPYSLCREIIYFLASVGAIECQL